MSRFMTASETLVQLTKWGVPFKEYPGWRTRTRPGAHSDARGGMVHHTGSMSQSDDYNNFLFVRGRPESGIPGPLCNVATDTDGDLILGSVGRANHAGKGSSSTLARVTADTAPLNGELRPGPDAIDGNAHYYGNEVKYDGARRMTPAQRRTALLYAASVCDFHDWGAGSWIGHREHTGRKNDPGKEPMDDFRTDLHKLLTTGGASGADPGEPARDVTITIACIARVANQGLGVSGECLTDTYQVMNIAVWFYPKMAETTRPAYWRAVATGNWAEAKRLLNYAVRIIQAEAGIRQDGVFGPSTALFLSKRGYVVR
jgi:hypothetical protein